MSIEAELRAEFDRKERRQDLVFQILPYSLLAICAAITVGQRIWGEQTHTPAVLGLSALAALWLIYFHTLRRRHRIFVSVVHYCGLLVIIAALAALAPWYGLFAFVGYPQAFQYLRGWWRYVGAAATAIISTMAFLGGLAKIQAEHWWGLWLGVGVVAAMVAVIMFFLAEMAEYRNSRQKQAVAELDEANRKLQEAMAENSGLHAQLLVQAREAGVRDERSRMAGEIHDTIAQGLTGILTQLQAAEQTTTAAQHQRHLSNALELARESLTEARRSVAAQTPQPLVEAQLPDAVRAVTTKWAALQQIDTAVTLTGVARPLTTDIEITILRAAQEALANVAKHATATRVVVTLSYMQDVVSLDVRDDGCGFDSQALRTTNGHGGFGLIGLRHRAQRLAGRLIVESEPGAGTAISVSLPALTEVPTS